MWKQSVFVENLIVAVESVAAECIALSLQYIDHIRRVCGFLECQNLLEPLNIADFHMAGRHQEQIDRYLGRHCVKLNQGLEIRSKSTPWILYSHKSVMTRQWHGLAAALLMDLTKQYITVAGCSVVNLRSKSGRKMVLDLR